jgi:hypothetical protein
MIELQNLKHAIVTVAGGTALAAGLALLLLAGLVAVIIPAGLTLLCMAFGEARRRLRNLCPRLPGGNSLSRKASL